ncbi:MAG: hypothetical protein ACREJ0_08135 [Geminicoccaceae bacterium]
MTDAGEDEARGLLEVSMRLLHDSGSFNLALADPAARAVAR